MIYSLNTPEEVVLKLAKRAKELRLLKKWTRATLSKKSGVTASSLKRFEQTGKVSFDNLLKLVFCLGRMGEFEELLKAPIAKSIKDLEQKEGKVPKRGSI